MKHGPRTASPTPARRRLTTLPARRSGRLVSVLVAAVLATSLATAHGSLAGAQAKPTLVSNLNQPDGGTTTLQYDHAQAFTTGSNPNGYRVTSVEIEFASSTSFDLFDTTANNLIISMSVHSNVDGQPGRPGPIVGPLTNYFYEPTFSSDRTVKIGAHAGSFDLRPNTTYWLMIDVHKRRSANFARIRTTPNKAEDSGGTAGFSLANERLYRPGHNNSGVKGEGSVNDSWKKNHNEVLKVRINGDEVPQRYTGTATPGLEFESTQLAWDETSDGCGTPTRSARTGPHTVNFRGSTYTYYREPLLIGVSGNRGPTYKVRLTAQPFYDVSVVIKDPDDRPYRTDKPEIMGRLIVQNGTTSGIDGDRTRLTFTPANWDAWRTVQVKVACTSGNANVSVPIEHSMLSRPWRNGVVRNAYPGFSGVDAQRWNVWVDVSDDGTGQGARQAAPAIGPSDTQSSDSQPEQACVSDALLGDVQGYAGETWRESADHVERWSRVLAAFGVSNSYSNNPMTASEAQTLADRGLPRWVPVVTALECLETAPEEQPEAQPAQVEAPTPTTTPAPPPTPEVSISAGNDVTEGADATFTVTASPASASDLDVIVSISQSGDFAATGSRTVTISTTGSATFAVNTTDDSTDEADGSVTASLSTGTGYSVSSSSSTATVAVSDNDDTPPPPAPVTNCVSGTMLERVRDYYDANKDRAPGYGQNWKRVLIAFGDTTDTNLTAFTAAEATDRESRWSGWRPIRKTLECIEAAS